MKVSPCLRCTRVSNPRQCDDKNCSLWRQWFVEKWDSMRQTPRLCMERVKTEPEGVCIGGRFYSQPHRVREYLHRDPCRDCLCSGELCVLPCRIKRAWLQAREDVLI